VHPLPSASYSITVRLEVPSEGLPASQLTGAVESAGGLVTAFDVTAAHADRLQIDLTCAAPDADRAGDIVDALGAVEGVNVGKVSDRTFLLHLEASSRSGRRCRSRPRRPVHGLHAGRRPSVPPSSSVPRTCGG
jgi:hypothetical protein